MFALVDCNSFYASCEQLFNPKIRNKPVVVLSNNDGCVIARSKEAKELGIDMGEPAFKLKSFLKSNSVAVYSANFALYGDISRRVMQTLSSLCPKMEIYSIDEAFLDLSGFAPFEAYGQRIRTRVLEWVGIPTCVGIGATKTLAKIANYLAKKQVQYCGVCVLASEFDIEHALKNMPVENIWGVGRQYTKILNSWGVYTALEFRDLPPQLIRTHLKVVGLRIQNELKGISCLQLEEVAPAKQSVLMSRSFGQPLSEYDDLKQCVAVFAARCAEKLRRQQCSATQVSVFIRTNPHRLDEEQYQAERKITFSTPSDLTNEIIEQALRALKSIYRPNLRYQKAGVFLSGIVPNDAIQTNLFDRVERTRNKRIVAAVDALNSKFGRSTVRYGVEGYNQKWKMRQTFLSKRFTTSWTELLEVGG
jgi:DNA polymerase V